MNEYAPPIFLFSDKKKYRDSSQKKSYKIFDTKKERFYNSSISKNKINFRDTRSKSCKKKIKKDKNKKYKTRIAIKKDYLENLENKDLIELIQFISYTCDLTLNDDRYIGKTCGIFQIKKK